MLSSDGDSDVKARQFTPNVKARLDSDQNQRKAWLGSAQTHTRARLGSARLGSLSRLGSAGSARITNTM